MNKTRLLISIFVIFLVIILIKLTIAYPLIALSIVLGLMATYAFVIVSWAVGAVLFSCFLSLIEPAICGISSYIDWIQDKEKK